jgi:hypothetical protein
MEHIQFNRSARRTTPLMEVIPPPKKLLEKLMTPQHKIVFDTTQAV